MIGEFMLISRKGGSRPSFLSFGSLYSVPVKPAANASFQQCIETPRELAQQTDYGSESASITSRSSAGLRGGARFEGEWVRNGL